MEDLLLALQVDQVQLWLSHQNQLLRKLKQKRIQMAEEDVKLKSLWFHQERLQSHQNMLLDMFTIGICDTALTVIQVDAVSSATFSGGGTLETINLKSPHYQMAQLLLNLLLEIPIAQMELILTVPLVLHKTTKLNHSI